ncbi:hypothetical protein PHAVU_008G045300 [Phaseolus vulgaris]|uniref:Uncharacterized protein n=1 Tax=Phaseolus vulgaris TaxID=3885 RepID=V7B580_PHAVU|nr:hypothetical protein PHAVU_008G045300g [Phaseolus vulgaris]ESW11616.1 hypothetical protein PHAVU_008G045300g [Phaseolus vulgaris]
MHFSLFSKSSFLHSHLTNKQTHKHIHTTEQGGTHSTLPSMADSTPYTKPHFPLSRIQPKPTNQGKSCSGFIIKALFLALFIIVLPLFPSQAPDFVSQTIVNKFWELLHLLFIGIAVTYGLFSRRNSELDTHVEIETTHSSADDNATVPSYVSKVFPVSTIFDDGYENGNANENPCGVDEKRMNMMMHCWNPQNFDGGAGVVCPNGGGTVGVFDEQYKTHLPISEDSFGYSSVGCDGNGTNVVQAWNSEYYHSEPVVVVAQPNYKTGECGEVVDYKPLGLPIRSLRSVARDVDSPKYANESDSSSGSRGSSRASDKSGDKEFGDLGPSNLEKQFNDAAAAGGASASPIPWRSRNWRMDREKIYGNVTLPAHFRPLSVDETKFEAPSFSSHNETKFEAPSFSSHNETKFEAPSFSSRNMYSSLDSISSNNVNVQEEEMRQLEASYVSASEKMNFQQENVGQMKTSFVSVSEIMNFLDEDMGTTKASYDPTSENTSFQKTDLRKKIFQGSSSRNRRMGIKGKYGAASFPSHFRPMSVDETQIDSLGSKSLQSVRPFSSHTRIYSSLDSISSDMDFQEEDMGQKTSHMHTTENMNFEEEDMGQKKTSYMQASENVNFQEEDMEQKPTSYVPVSENMNFQEVDMGKKNFQMFSRNGMVESKGKYVADSGPSHLRPMSVDEAQLELLSSRSLQSMGSFSSQSSLCSSLDSVSSENMNLVKEDLGEKKSSRGSSSSSPSSLTRRNGEASSQAFQAQGYTNGSSLPDDIKSSLNDLRGLNEIGGEDPPSNKESRMHPLQSDSEKPASLAKAPSRGKSVRTRRTSGLISGTMRIGETSSKQTDEKVEKNVNNVESVLKKDKMKSGEPDLPLKGVNKKTLDSYCPKPEIKFSNHRTRDKLEQTKDLSKQDSDIELENTWMSSDESGVPEFVNDSDLDSEVDKKASEFIAKFKAQIRLQKMGSIDRAKEQKIIGNKIR